MERFVHRANLERLRRLLREADDKEQRRKLEQLIAEEEAKDPVAPKRKD